MKILSSLFKFISNILTDPHVQAMGRAGLGEVAQVLPDFNDGIKPVEAYGLMGNPLPQTLHENLQEYKAPELEFNNEMESDYEMQM